MTAAGRRALAAATIAAAEKLLKEFGVPVKVQAGPVRVDLKPEKDGQGD